MVEHPNLHGNKMALKTDEPTNSVLWNYWYPLARSQDLQPNTILSARLLDTDLVLWRDSQNQVAAWLDRCPHRGASLSCGAAVHDRLICPYHGLAFNTQGQCVQIPAHPDSTPSRRACIQQAYPVQERYGLIFVCPGHPLQELPHFPEWDLPQYRHFLGGPYHYHSSAFRAIENFFDIAHFPFVHQGLLGDPKHAEVKDYQVIQKTDGMTCRDVRFWQPDPDGTGEGRLIQNTYHLPHPLAIYFSKESDDRRLTIFFMAVPVEAERCIGWMAFALNYAHEVPADELKAFQDQVVAEDLAIVDTLYPRRLPLDLQWEFHLPCDRASVAYRRWLAELGITFGTIPAPTASQPQPFDQSSKAIAQDSQLNCLQS